MSNTTTTPNMSLILPLPGIQTGIAYAQNLNQAFTVVDSHTHVTGSGVPITTAAININLDLPFNSNNAISMRTVRFNSQGSVLTASTDSLCIYAVGTDLYYNDNNGNKIQITAGGVVNTSSSGNISGMGGTTATVVYTSGNATFTFDSDADTPAIMKFGPIQIGLNSASPSFVTLNANASQITDYSLTLPISNPSSTSTVLVDSSGNMSFAVQENFFLPPGLIMAYGGTSVPSGWLECNGQTISRSTYSALFAAIDINYGYGNNTTTFNVPDLRGRFLRGVSGASGRDPDASSRTVMNTGGNVGNNVGSIQSASFDSHTHVQDAHDHNATQVSHTHSVNTAHTDATNFSTAGSDSASLLTGNQNSSSATPAITVALQTAINQSTGGNETRPINAYVIYIIKT